MSPQNKKKRTLSDRWKFQRTQYNTDFFLELALGYLAIAFVMMQALDMSVLEAALWAPLVLGGGFLGLYVVVVAFGIVLNGLDRIRNKLGGRRGPS